MTTQDHNNQDDAIVATFADGQAARRASLAIETLGIDSSRVHVDAKADVSSQVSESHMDTAAMRRPRNRAVTCGLIGAVVGAGAGLIVGTVSDSIPAVMALALFVIPGVIIGALWGLFWGLPTNPEIVDADAGGPVKLTVDVSGLDAGERRSALEKLKEERPIRLAGD